LRCGSTYSRDVSLGPQVESRTYFVQIGLDKAEPLFDNTVDIATPLADISLH
jgi:hypothetical protein